MRFGRLLLLVPLMLAPAAYSLDHSPPPSPKGSTSKDPTSKDSQNAQPAAKDGDAEVRLKKWESHMMRRDQEMDKRMKSTQPNDSARRGRGR